MLDEQQKAAVESTAEKTMVVAGPGSGKTRVLVERMAHMLDHGASPYEIISFSFTRKSAMELNERLVARIGAKAHALTCGTSHSVALEMIRRFDQRRAHFSVYGETETQMVLKDVAEEMGVFKKTWKIPKRDIDSALLRYATDSEYPAESDPAYPIVNAFFKRLEQNKAFIYDDLLVRFSLLIPELSRYLNWKHILVDECQDLTPLQWQIVYKIAKCFDASIFAVGDPDQSIYKFRGACPEEMIKADGFFQVFLLENNYRSVPDIVRASNRVIRHNKNRVQKESVPVRLNDPICPAVKVFRNVDSAEIVHSIHDTTEPVAVLARNHFLLKKISDLLNERDIDHTYAGQKNNMLKELPAVTVHSFMRLICNHHDNFSFMVVRKILGVDDKEYAEIRYHAAKNGMSHLEAWTELSVNDVMAKDFFGHFTGQDIVLDVFGGLYATVDPFQVDIGDIEYAQIAAFISHHGQSTIKQYLDYIATFDVQDELMDDDAPLITLSTIHAAKGLEFKTVIVAGLNEGIFPGSRAEAAGEIEDERNLAFVAFSRAKDALALTIRPELAIDAKGNEHRSPESRFVGEAYAAP